MLSLIEESYHSCRAPLREQRRGGVDHTQRYKRQPSSLVRHRPGASEGGARRRRVLKERCTTFGNRERTKVRGRRGGCGKGGGEEETVRNGELGARSARQRVSALPHLWTGTYAHSRERRGGVKTEKQGVVVRQVEREQKPVKTPPSPLPMHFFAMSSETKNNGTWFRPISLPKEIHLPALEMRVLSSSPPTRRRTLFGFR